LLLLLSDQNDILCRDLLRALKECSVRLVEDFFGESAKVVLRVDSGGTSSVFRLGDGSTISDRDILGVMVRKPLFRPKEGWSLADAGYLHAEKEAALLGWIWSLRCPVINRYGPEMWFGPSDSLDYWGGRLERAGLEPEPATEEGSTRSYLASVIGARVIWDQGAPERLTRLNSPLIEFSGELGLTYVEFRISASINGPCVSAVEPFPKYDVFSLSTRQEIVSELIARLTSSKGTGPARSESDSWF
jgi:hypothetical protein